MKYFFKFLIVFVFIFFLVSCDGKKYTILFDGNGGTLVSGEETQKIEKALDIVPPTYERDGYIFKGWNVDLSTIISDQIVKAEWEETIKYKKVNFDSNGGVLTSNEIQKVEEGKQISIPSNPIRIGYTFDGWYLGDEKWSFKSDIVTIDLTLTAHWIINQYTLTIKYNDGITEDKIITQDYNTCILVSIILDYVPKKINYSRNVLRV